MITWSKDGKRAIIDKIHMGVRTEKCNHGLKFTIWKINLTSINLDKDIKLSFNSYITTLLDNLIRRERWEFLCQNSFINHFFQSLDWCHIFYYISFLAYRLFLHVTHFFNTFLKVFVTSDYGNVSWSKWI